MPSSIDTSSVASYDSDEEYRLAQEEWEESLEQLKQLVSVVLFPSWVSGWAGAGATGVCVTRPVFLPADHCS